METTFSPRLCEAHGTHEAADWAILDGTGEIVDRVINPNEAFIDAWERVEWRLDPNPCGDEA